MENVITNCDVNVASQSKAEHDEVNDIVKCASKAVREEHLDEGH